MDENLHSPQRLLIELRIEHAALEGQIDAMLRAQHQDHELLMRRLKKRRLLVRDRIGQLEGQLEPPEPA
jgi:hypothetical protein